MYVIFHSEDDIKLIKKDDIYTPLFVGRDGKDNFGFCSDDSFDGNISFKNKYYCELTGLYWMWKVSSADVLGLCHYRRYFKSDSGKLIGKEDIEDYLSCFDIILPKKLNLIKESMWETYDNSYIGEGLKITQNVIEKLYPEYLETFNMLLSQRSFSNFNMFIASKEITDEYCSWLFSILEEVESCINIEDYPRVFGLISEVILNVWVEYNNLKVKECNIHYIGFKLKFLVFISSNTILRKVYQFLHVNLFKKSSFGKKIEHFIQKLVY